MFSPYRLNWSTFFWWVIHVVKVKRASNMAESLTLTKPSRLYGSSPVASQWAKCIVHLKFLDYEKNCTSDLWNIKNRINWLHSNVHTWSERARRIWYYKYFSQIILTLCLNQSQTLMPMEVPSVYQPIIHYYIVVKISLALMNKIFKVCVS